MESHACEPTQIQQKPTPSNLKPRGSAQKPVRCGLEGSKQRGFQRPAGSPAARHKRAIAQGLCSSSVRL